MLEGQSRETPRGEEGVLRAEDILHKSGRRHVRIEDGWFEKDH